MNLILKKKCQTLLEKVIGNSNMSFKMRGSPLLKDVKRWNANGEQITVDDSALSPTDEPMDDYGNKTIKYNYIDKSGNKAHDILYENKPRGESEIKEGEGPNMPSDKPIEEEKFYT